MKSDTAEHARLQELQSYEILDTPPEDDFDHLTQLAARICETPIALVTLLDDRRLWFKSALGLDICEIERAVAFCAYAIEGDSLLMVPDAQKHPLFADNPLVTGEPNIRFYAGVPLVTPSGHGLGTLCVIDTVPRELAAQQLEALQTLAEQVMTQLELRRQRKNLESVGIERDRMNVTLRHQADHLNVAQRIAHIGSWQFHIAENRLIWSDQIYSMFDIARDEFEQNFESFLSFVHPEDRAHLLAAQERVLRGDGPLDVQHRLLLRDSQVHHVQELGELITDETDGTQILSGTMQDITAQKLLQSFKKEQSAILERIAADAPLTEILHAVLRLVEAQYPAALCSILLLDADGKRLHNGAACKLPEAYLQAIEGIAIGPMAGSCGPAAFEQRNVIVTDIATDPLWADYRDLALSHNLRACWSLPVFSGNRVVATFATYSATPHTPSAEEIDMVGSCAHLVGVAIQRQQSQNQLKLLETSVSHLNDIVMITEAEPFDEPGPRILFVNEAFVRRTGYSREEVLGKTPRMLQGPNTQRTELDRIKSALRRWEPVRAELINYTKSGEEFWLELEIVPVADATGCFTHWVSIERDISQRKHAEDEILHLAYYDHLTQLPNRRLLLDRLQHVLAAHARSKCYGALLFIDLDNFKMLNDTFGHGHGDQLLQLVAARLKQCTRAMDTVARLGGDEFVVMLTTICESLPEAANSAELIGARILSSFIEPFRIGEHEHHSTPSIGIAMFSDTRDSLDDLLKHADFAMYQAKAAGRNTLRFFDPAMQNAVSARASLEEDLRHGLHNKEFFLCYQPQVVGDGGLVGAEALIRWQHPQRGLVSPAEFIPLAEAIGLILPLGLWVLEQACTQLVLWAGDPLMAHLSIAVNVSVHQYRHTDFVKQVLEVLDRTGARPQNLKLELTESVFADDLEDIIAKMTSLKLEGISFSLDDFGTGYSSLSYLKRLPFDQLKIDQSFVKDLFTDANDAAIVRTIVVLGQTLGLSVIAEGVETEAQRDFLARHGCHAYQGYLFSRPLPIDNFEAFVRTHNKSQTVTADI